MPSTSLLGSRRPAGVTGTHRGQCASAACTILLLVLMVSAARAAPTTVSPIHVPLAHGPNSSPVCKSQRIVRAEDVECVLEGT